MNFENFSLLELYASLDPEFFNKRTIEEKNH